MTLIYNSSSNSDIPCTFSNISSAQRATLLPTASKKKKKKTFSPVRKVRTTLSLFSLPVPITSGLYKHILKFSTTFQRWKEINLAERKSKHGYKTLKELCLSSLFSFLSLRERSKMIFNGQMYMEGSGVTRAEHVGTWKWEKGETTECYCWGDLHGARKRRRAVKRRDVKR